MYLVCGLLIQCSSCQISLTFITPAQIACGYVPDVSALLDFHWWQPMYYAEQEGTFAK